MYIYNTGDETCSSSLQIVLTSRCPDRERKPPDSQHLTLHLLNPQQT